VVSDSVSLGDLCEISGFDREAAAELGALEIATAPPVGGTRLIHMDMIRDALVRSGTNMARLTLRGATQCTVSRPSCASPIPLSTGVGAAESTARGASGHDPGAADTPLHPDSLTLRQAVLDHFNAELARYGGTAEIVFDRASDQVLDLTGPPYEFKVRRRGGSPLGLTPLEVGVVADGRIVQTVPMVVQASMLVTAVAARRAINQGATIRSADVNLVSLAVTRLDKLGFEDTAQVVGQRAKRFVPTGTLLEPDMLESVPLVRRGDYVKLTSAVGSVRVVTSARATADGLLGDVITVRAADNKRLEYDAVVVGPGAVQVGSGLPQRLHAGLALGGDSP
jgi:flagella basal body P-ring formation protein FlgA